MIEFNKSVMRMNFMKYANSNGDELINTGLERMLKSLLHPSVSNDESDEKE